MRVRLRAPCASLRSARKVADISRSYSPRNSAGSIRGDGREAERVVGARVTWDYFRTLGLRPSLGRDFEPAEDHPERRRVAIISDELLRPL
jgi:hypothetical protein